MSTKSLNEYFAAQPKVLDLTTKKSVKKTESIFESDCTGNITLAGAATMYGQISGGSSLTIAGKKKHAPYLTCEVLRSSLTKSVEKGDSCRMYVLGQQVECVVVGVTEGQNSRNQKTLKISATTRDVLNSLRRKPAKKLTESKRVGVHPVQKQGPSIASRYFAENLLLK
jgi:hypothetical protein